MAQLKGQMLDCWDLTPSQLSLYLSRRLAIGKSGDDQPENIKRESVMEGGGGGGDLQSPIGLSWWPRIALP